MSYKPQSSHFVFLCLSTLLFFACQHTSCLKKGFPRAVKQNEEDVFIKETGADSVSFIVVGDWGKYGRQYQTAVAKQMDAAAKKFNSQFVISTGDNFYPSGVASVDDAHWKRSYENIYHKKGKKLDWYPVLGNHDYITNAAAEVAYASKNKRWKMPSRYYILKHGITASHTALFLFTDTSPFVGMYHNRNMSDLKSQDTALQLQWLQQTLAPATDAWKIVVGHHPVYSTGPHGNTNELIQRFKPLLLQNKVDFYLAGHDHSLQYNKVPGEGVRYFVSGGGAETTRVYANNYTVFARATPGFLVVTLYAQTANLYFYNHYGHLLYKHQVRKQAS